MCSIKKMAVSLSLMTCLTLPYFAAARQQKRRAAFPGTPAGQRLDEFLRAYNTGNLETIRGFIADRYDKEALTERSAEQRAKTSVATFSLTRQLNLHSIERSTDHEIVALCQSKITEAWFSITIRVAPRPPYGIVSQGFGFATRPADAIPHGRLNQTQIVEELNAYLAKLAGADMLSGAVLVAKSGRPISERAYGFNASGMPNRIDTKFDLASMSKMFTGVAVAQLAEQGKLSYGDSIGRLLPDYPNKEAAEKITLHHLLTHTSGLVDYSDKKEYRPARQAQGDRFKTLKDWLPFFAGDPLSFEPGKRSEYSNSGFIVLGVIIEKVSGQNYFDYVREHIFMPAEMNQTALTVALGNSAGGGLSTVGDMLKFDAALRRHKLLGAKYTHIILAPKVETREGEAWGYGFEISQANGKRIVGHSGGGDADNKLDMYLDDGYTIIALTKPYAATNITRKFKELITQGN
jgi:CubicO group peptidase (beta-lactamase class C family)